MAKIMIACPQTGRRVWTGLTEQMVDFKSLPQAVTVPLSCPACGRTHLWQAQAAFLDGADALVIDMRRQP